MPYGSRGVVVAGGALLLILVGVVVMAAPSLMVTLEQAIPAGGGISASSTPVWAFVLALLGMIGAGLAGLRLLGPRE